MTPPAQNPVVASVHATCDAKYTVETTMRKHRVGLDEPTARGGNDTGPTPLEALTSALAACSAITLRMYAERKGWELQTVRVDCRAFAAGDGVRFERSIRIGAAIDETQRARLAEIAEKTPVTKIVRAGSPIATDVQ